ncbi:MAG: hypothetical protein J0H43_06810 [Actinobacteria bacterium]|nr:hypothetical protein [Actinomycetota bacterium]
MLEALRQLDATQAAVIRLVYFDGLTQKQAAVRLHLSTARVARSMSRGLQALTRVLT